MSKRVDKYRDLPVFKKAHEIYELAKAIAEALKDDEQKEHLATEIISNAMIAQAKIAGAEGAGLFSIRMQNAVLIKVAIHDMFNAVLFASMVEINEEDYVQLMRDKVEEFRIVFREWMLGFDKEYDIPDNWGIRFDVASFEQDKLDELMFDEEHFFTSEEENGFGFDDDDEDESDEEKYND